jgi:hypothetical protein
MTNAAFLEKIMTGISVIKKYGGSIGWNKGAIKDKLVTTGVALPGSTTKKHKSSTKANGNFLAVAFLSLVDKGRYIKLLEELENNFTMGVEHYPDIATNAYNLVVNYKHQHRPVGRLFNYPKWVSFTNVENARGDADTSHIHCYSCYSCYRCYTMEHYADECPTPTPRPPTKTRASMLTMADEGGDSESDGYNSVDEFSFHEGDKYVNPNWILLDNHSTPYILCKPNLMSNIHESVSRKNIHCNAGTHCIM